ncbi:MAG TPA: hypothetical protein VIO81_11020 [Methyloversatilis sp.]
MFVGVPDRAGSSRRGKAVRQTGHDIAKITLIRTWCDGRNRRRRVVDTALSIPINTSYIGHDRETDA